MDGGSGSGAAEWGKKEAMLGVQLALGLWEGDPHGVGVVLAEKRRGRNAWGVGQGLFESLEERERSGVDVWVEGDGREVLVEGGRRPWAGR